MSGIDLTAIHDIKELLVPIATSVTLLSVAISSWLALRQYRLKLRSEKIENDIKLVKAFAELLNLAHARSQTTDSEKFLDKLFENEIISNADFQGFDLGQKIQTAALTVPVGLAARCGNCRCSDVGLASRRVKRRFNSSFGIARWSSTANAARRD
jgi:hypothetical protein